MMIKTWLYIRTNLKAKNRCQWWVYFKLDARLHEMCRAKQKPWDLRMVAAQGIWFGYLGYLVISSNSKAALWDSHWHILYQGWHEWRRDLDCHQLVVDHRVRDLA